MPPRNPVSQFFDPTGAQGFDPVAPGTGPLRLGGSSDPRLGFSPAPRAPSTSAPSAQEPSLLSRVGRFLTERSDLEPGNPFSGLNKIQQAGLLLRDVAASVRGNEIPSEALAARRIAERDAQQRRKLAQLQLANAQINQVNQLAAPIDDLPEGPRRKEAIKNARQFIRDPRSQKLFDLRVQDARVSPESLEDLRSASPAFAVLEKAVGLRRAIDLTENTIADDLRRRADSQNISSIASKKAFAEKFLRENNPELARRLGDLDSVEELELIRRALPEQNRFTQSELQTITTNEEARDILGIRGGGEKIGTPIRLGNAQTGEFAIAISQNDVEAFEFLTRSLGLDVLPDREEVGEPGSFDTKNRQKLEKEIDDAALAVSRAAKLSNEIIQLSQGREEVLGAAGALAGGVEELRATAIGLSKIFNTSFEVDGKQVEDADSFIRSAAAASAEQIEGVVKIFGDEGALQKKAIDRSQIRSATISLAAQVAISNNPGGKISERDFSVALDEIGKSASPQVFNNTVRRVAQRAVSRLEDQIRIAEARGANVAPARAILESTRQSLAQSRDIGALSEEELLELDVRALSASERAVLRQRLQEMRDGRQ